MKISLVDERSRRLGIGEMSCRTGVNIETIRYYEKTGVLPAPPRTDGGRRVYDDTDVKRLRFIRRARELGFTMANIRDLMDLGGPADASCPDVCAVAEPHLERIREKIRSLQRLEAELVNAMRRCDEMAGIGCGVIDALCPKPGDANAGS